MSSLIRYATRAVKVPAGRTFYAQPDQQFLITLSSSPYCFQKSDIDSLLSSGFVKVSDTLYSAKTNADLDTVLTALDGLNAYNFDNEEYSTVDLGKTIRIGVDGGDNDVITMRLVKRTGNVESLGGPNNFPNVCYVVTGNRMGEAYYNALYCCVYGTTPNNRTRKPFLNNIGGDGPLMIPAATFESVLSPLIKVSGSLYLAHTVSEFEDVLTNFDISSNYVEFESNEVSSIDMGKTIRVGISGVDNDLLVFRLIKRTGNLASLGQPNYDAKSVGYVCIASKVNQSDYEGATEPHISGSTPNALEVKPQFLLNYGYEPYIFTDANLSTIFADCISVSKTFYLAKNATQLASVCSALDNVSGRDRFTANTATTVDLGKTIRFGIVGGESDLITFASSKGQSDAGNGNQLTAGNIVVANKLAQDYNSGLNPVVFGSAPRDS